MTTPVRPAEPAEPTTLVFSRVLTVDEARQVRDLLVRFSDVQDEREAARAEAASLRERLSAVEGERDRAKHEAEMTLGQYRAVLDQDLADHDAYEAMKVKALALASEQDAELANARVLAAEFESNYVEVAEAIGYVNRAEGGAGYAVADHATIMEAVRKLVRDEVDAEEFKRMAVEHEAAKARVSELRGLLQHHQDTRSCFYEANGKGEGECRRYGDACPYCAGKEWLAAHPLKTEGDGGTPTGGTRP